MLKNRLLALTLAMVFVLSIGSVAMASTFEEEATVGQPEDHDGTVTRVEFRIIDVEVEDDHYTWYLVMPYRGDFGDTAHLDDGWIINVWTDRQGNFVLYIMVHEDDPRYDEDDELWGSWSMFKEILAGRYYSTE